MISEPYRFSKLIYVNLQKTKITELSILMLITGIYPKYILLGRKIFEKKYLTNFEQRFKSEKLYE